MANPKHHDIDEEDPDILALRAAALSSLASKDPKRDQTTDRNFHNFSVGQGFMPEHHNGMNQMNYRGPRQNFPNQAPEMFHQQLYNQQQMFQQRMNMRPNFAPRRPQYPQPIMPSVPPHVNPHFMTQNHTMTPSFVSLEMIPPVTIGQNEDMPLMPEQNGFIPTPPTRLSPRSAQFVAENNKALRRSRRRSPSHGRSRSPYKRRYDSSSRSRSPHYKAQISHIARKRTRSKSVEAAYTNKFTRRTRSPRRRSKSSEKRVSPKHSENKRSRANNHNGNGNSRLHNTREIDLKSRTPPKTARDKDNITSLDETSENVQAQSSTKESAITEVKTKREKTEQELEDELLASTDSDSSKEDEDDLKVTLDEKDLDFLDDDEEESENEGRFKSNSSSKPNSAPAVSNFKPSFASKYRRNRYNDEPKRDKKRSRSPLESSQRNKDERRYTSPMRKQRKSTDVQKSPDVSRKYSTKEPVQSTRIIVNNKEKESTKEKDKPLFKATFKSVDPPVDDKRKEKESRKDDRVRLVRGSVVSRVAEKPKDLESKRPAIMKRLGGYIKDSKGKKSWAKEQIVQILQENFLRELRIRKEHLVRATTTV